MTYDQDFINDGYADAPPLKTPMVCPKCGRRITTLQSGMVRCLARVPREGPRAKGEPRKVPCNTVMVNV